MFITGYGTIKPTNTTRKRDGTSSVANFSDYLAAAETTETATTKTAALSTTANLSGILALQEVSEEERKREAIVKRGKNMLGVLERLRQRLLMGDIPEAMLGELSEQLAEQKQTISDPNLMMVMEDIELRLAVELAKLEMAHASRAQLE